ncbi:hypothetical protein KY285_001393 [Solanum tuberosum]|nr:hypothetical protein KY285_001393 [Solanum tuberosum]
MGGVGFRLLNFKVSSTISAAMKKKRKRTRSLFSIFAGEEDVAGLGRVGIAR